MYLYIIKMDENDFIEFFLEIGIKYFTILENMFGFNLYKEEVKEIEMQYLNV